MTRRKQSGLDELLALLTTVPTWVGPLLAVLAYVACRYLLPALSSVGEPSQMAVAGRSVLVSITRGLAPVAAGLVLMVWIVAEVKKRVDRRRLDATGSIGDIRRLSWREFELLVAEAYRRKGYLVEETDSPSGDGGVDLVLHADGERTLVQCKHWQQRQVGVKVVRELYGVMHDQGAARGIIACLGEYTPEARDFAERNGIELVTGRELVNLVAAVKAPSGHSSPTDGAKAESAAGEASDARRSAVPSCPACGAKMVLRTAQMGANAGRQFWGCSRYPQCRGTRQV